MKFQSKNMHYVFHREYFDGLELLRETGAHSVTQAQTRNVTQTHSVTLPHSVEERNQAVFTFPFPKADLFAGLRQLPDFHAFQLVTTYPGTLIGTGNPHDAKLDAAIKLGFSFDYVTGLPYLPGSSLKGMLRSRFPGKYTGEDKADREILIGAYLGRDDIDAEALETEIFDGGDIFLGAFPLDWPEGMLSMEYITPHKEFHDPVPISLLKIKPNVRFEFAFLLSDGQQIDAAQKCALFRELVMESGVGAKTNVGYGRMVKPEARPKPNRIGYDPRQYEYMNGLMKERAQRNAAPPRQNRPLQSAQTPRQNRVTPQNRTPQASQTQAPQTQAPRTPQGNSVGQQSRTPQGNSVGQQSRTPQTDNRTARNALGKCPVCGAEIVSGYKFPSCAGNCGFRPGRPRGYRKPVTEDEYRRLFHGESVLMRGFESQYGVYDALVRLKGAQAPQIDRATGQSVRYGDYQVERQI